MSLVVLHDHLCNSPEDQDYGPEAILSEKKEKKRKKFTRILHYYKHEAVSAKYYNIIIHRIHRLRPSTSMI